MGATGRDGAVPGREGTKCLWSCGIQRNGHVNGMIAIGIDVRKLHGGHNAPTRTSLETDARQMRSVERVDEPAESHAGVLVGQRGHDELTRHASRRDGRAQQMEL